MSAPSFRTRALSPEDVASGFRSGTRQLDDYFHRHALANDRGDVGRTHVLEATAADLQSGLPTVLGFYTLSMASVTSQEAASVIVRRLPRYPMPVALIGRLAVDERARGRRHGETLLIDALARAVAASKSVACLGVIVDAKDFAAEAFYGKYDFVTVDSTSWPRRMFLPIEVARTALAD